MDKFYIFIALTVVLNASSQLLLKTGAMRIGEVELSTDNLAVAALQASTNPWILLGLTTMTLSMITHLLALSRFDVSFAFPFISISYVIVAIFGALLLGEEITALRLMGILTIIAGTAMVASSS